MKPQCALSAGKLPLPISILFLLVAPGSAWAAAGDIDAAFGVNGVAIVDFGSGEDQCHGVVIQPDGRIVAGGWAFNGSNFDFALARFNPDGSLDASFGNGGKVTTRIGSGNDQAKTVR